MRTSSGLSAAALYRCHAQAKNGTVLALSQSGATLAIWTQVYRARAFSPRIEASLCVMERSLHCRSWLRALPRVQFQNVRVRHSRLRGNDATLKRHCSAV